MEKFQELRSEARKKLFMADHILTQSYPLLNDKRLLLAVLENLFLAFTNAIGSVLYYELLFKRVPPFSDNFNSKFELFKEKCAPKYKIDLSVIHTMKEIRDIIILHKKSPVEFHRKDSFIICNQDYQMKAITVDGLKNYINKAKLFIEVVTSITSKDEGIFMKSEPSFRL